MILSSPTAEPRDAIDFDEFFRQQHPRLVACALAITSDRERARDSAQEALARAYRDWSQVSRLDHPGAWVRRVLVHLLVDEGRRDRFRRAEVRHREGRHEDTPPSDSPLLASIRRLPTRQRTAVVLHHLDDLPIEQVADVMGVAVGTVKATLHQARAALARDLEATR